MNLVERDEAMDEARLLALQEGVPYVVVPMGLDFYIAMSHEAYLYSDYNDYVAYFDEDGNERDDV